MGARSVLADLRRRLLDQTAAVERLRAERGDLALRAESGDKGATKRRDELRRLIPEAEQRVAEIREAIPQAEIAARVERRNEVAAQRAQAIARTAEALAAFDHETAELAPIVDALAERMSALTRRQREILVALRPVITADLFDALQGLPIATHVVGRLVKLEALPRDLLPPEYAFGTQLIVPPLDRGAVKTWSTRIRQIIRALTPTPPGVAQREAA